MICEPFDRDELIWPSILSDMLVSLAQAAKNNDQLKQDESGQNVFNSLGLS